MQAEAVTNIGLVRKMNEDAFICDVEKQIFIVADGMGGHLAGEVASKLAIDTVYQAINEYESGTPSEFLREAFYKANNCIYEGAKQEPQYAGMGTTLTAAWIVEGQIYVNHVGDSRAYLIRDGKIKSLTKDHSVVGELMRGGGITEEQAMVHPQKNVLTRALGSTSLVEVDGCNFSLLSDDYLLLCTDGMSNLVTSEEIAEIIVSMEDINKAVKELLNLALERGGYDNITAILVANK